MDTIHPQVPVLDFQCDEEIAELITLMNDLGIVTLLSCQDSERRRGTVRRVWVHTFGQVSLPFLGMLDKPGEAGDPESLSNRMAPQEETEPRDWEAYRENRAWHYEASFRRINGQLMPLEISIRFPYTDLPVVVERLREAARELDGTTIRRPSDEGPGQGESNSQA